MSTTSKSISVVVPVHNAERTLNQQIGRLLEVLPDIAASFEVLIVDDGSTDHTEDVAIELALQYPQVRVTRHGEQLGIEKSAQTGAALTTGDVVIVHAGQEAVNSSQLQEIWEQRTDEELVVAPVGSHVGGVSPEVIRELENWGQGLAEARIDPPLSGGLKKPANRKTAATRRSNRTPKATAPVPMFQFDSTTTPSSMHQ